MLYHSLSHLVCYSPCACPSAGKTTSNFGQEDNKGNPPTNTGALHTYREHHKTKTRLVAALTTLWQAANKQTSHWSKCRQGAVNWAAAATWEGKCSGFVGRLAWALTCLDSWEIYNSSITPVQSKGSCSIKWQINLELNFWHCLGKQPRRHFLPLPATSGWNLSACQRPTKGMTPARTQAQLHREKLFK